MRCPQCDSENLGVESYAVCDGETGYRDSGVRYFCRECGAEIRDEEMAAHMEAESDLEHARRLV